MSDKRGVVVVYQSVLANGTGVVPLGHEAGSVIEGPNKAAIDLFRDRGYEVMVLATTGPSNVEVHDYPNRVQRLEDLKAQIMMQNPSLVGVGVPGQVESVG